MTCSRFLYRFLLLLCICTFHESACSFIQWRYRGREHEFIRLSNDQVGWSVSIMSWKNFESHMNALFRYSLTNPKIVGVLLVASCPQIWQYIPFSSEPQFRQLAYGIPSCIFSGFDFRLFLPIILSLSVMCLVCDVLPTMVLIYLTVYGGRRG